MDLFEREKALLVSAQERLATDDFDQSAAAREAFSDLVAAYEKLLREYRRLVRMADRTGEQLHDANAKVNEQNQELSQAYSKLRDAQEEIVRAEKLAALGGLVAGVAHEINTPLGIIRTASSTLKQNTDRLRGLAEEGKARKSDVFAYFETAGKTVDLIDGNADRAANLIESFKGIAVDRTADDRRTFDLGDYLKQILRSLEPELRKTQHRVSLESPEGVEMDSFPGAFSQLVTNLVMNSIKHGFDDTVAGDLRLAVSRESPDMVKLVYADNGRGVPQELHETMFDPFVTTKRGQGGSGLGLNIVHNLVTTRLGGTICYMDHDGGGAVFEMTLPLSAPTTTPNEEQANG